MTIQRSDAFVRDYKWLPLSIQKKVDRQIKTLLTYGITHPGLSVRKMVNQSEVWEMRVDIHYRMTFHLSQDVIFFRRVGTHEVYRNP